MRTSGRGSSSETLMFIAPAAIIAALYLWHSGGVVGLLPAVDRWILRSGQAIWDVVSSLVS